MRSALQLGPIQDAPSHAEGACSAITTNLDDGGRHLVDLDTQETNMAAQPPLLYDTRTAARRLGISRASLYAVFQRGEIATIKIGGRRLVSADELTRFVSEKASRTFASNWKGLP